MSITLLQVPERLNPAYNQQHVIASSTNSGQDGFKYIVEVKLDPGDNPVTWDTIFTAYVPPNPDGLLVINVGEVISNYVTHDLVPAEAGIKTCDNSIVRYYVSVTEYWNNTVSGVTQVDTGSIVPNASGYTDTTHLAWNAAMGFKDFQSYNYTDWMNSTEGDGRLLTNMTTNNIFTNQNAWLYLVNEVTDGTTGDYSFNQIRIRTYDSSNTLIDTFVVTNNYKVQTDSDVGQFLNRIPSGTYNLNQISFADFVSGAQPIITASVAKYRIDLGYLVGGVQSYRIDHAIYNIVDNCYDEKYTPYRIHWLNRFGGFDSFNFHLLSNITDTNTKQSYSQMLGTVTANTWGYNLYDRTDVVMSSKNTTTIQLNSDNITADEAEYLRELISSPVVFIELSPSEVYATKVLTSQYSPTRKTNEKVTNLTIEVTLPEYSAQRY